MKNRFRTHLIILLISTLNMIIGCRASRVINDTNTNYQGSPQVAHNQQPSWSLSPTTNTKEIKVIVVDRYVVLQNASALAQRTGITLKEYEEVNLLSREGHTYQAPMGVPPSQIPSSTIVYYRFEPDGIVFWAEESVANNHPGYGLQSSTQYQPCMKGPDPGNSCWRMLLDLVRHHGSNLIYR
ncbi:MAG: hypothetical protein AAFY41_09940 [Bacteroidota bacterium]